LSKSFTRSVARIAVIGSVLAAAQLMVPVGIAAADPYPNSVATVTHLNLERNIAQYGANTTATVRVTDGGLAGTPVGTITLRVFGDVQTEQLSGGTASFTLPRRLPAQETYTVRAYYHAPAESRYMDSRDSTNYTVVKANTTAHVRAADVTRDERPRVHVRVTSATGLTPHGDVRVRLIKNGDVRRSTIVTLRDGEATVSFRPVWGLGEWTARVVYLGNDNFRRDVGQAIFIVTRP